MLSINEPDKKASGCALFTLGFRPFFLLAATSALLLVLIWVPYFSGHLALNNHFTPIDWHAHEMLFGYTLAVIAGFLLTAVPNWTGQSTATGKPLMLLAVIWLLGRLVCSLPLGLPPLAIALIDLSFIPLLILSLSAPLIRAGKPRNAVFLIILSLFFIANGAMHLEALGTATTARFGIDLSLDLVLLMIVIIGGRVIPFFTRNALGSDGVHSWPMVDKLAVFSVVILIALSASPVPGIYTSLWALAAGCLQLLRLYGWHQGEVWRQPILWVLHLGYLFVAISLIMRGLAPLGLYSPSAAVHCFTLGGLGLITFGMMARVALGHSGRPLRFPARIVIAVLLLVVATLSRIFAGSTPFASHYLLLIQLSAGVWVISFGLFISYYLPLLWRPRLNN